MPIYIYKCNICNVVFEVLSNNKRIYDICPHCSSTNTTKQVAKPGYRRDHTVLEN